MTRSTNRAVERAADLLSLQHKALTTGDFAKLADLPNALEAAMAGLAKARPTRADIDLIRRAAARNSDLLKAAQRGVAKAQIQLRPSHQPALTTYDPAGNQRDTSGRSGRLLSRR